MAFGTATFSVRFLLQLTLLSSLRPRPVVEASNVLLLAPFPNPNAAASLPPVPFFGAVVAVAEFVDEVKVEADEDKRGRVGLY